MASVNSHGINIYYEVHGGGPTTLILAHGMGGNAAIWFHQIAHFFERYRIIVFDHRYFARSACDEDQFDPTKFPDDVLAIMAAEQVTRAVFICQSMGGWTGSQMALNHPDRVQGLVMSHTPGVFTRAGATLDRSAVADLVNRPATSFGSPALAHDYPQKNPAGAVLYQQVSSFNGIDPAVIPRKIGEADIGVDTSTLTEYKVPTLFVTADKDVLFPPGYITPLAATVPGAKCINLGDAGHSSYFEIPEAFNKAVDEFLSSLEL